MGAVLKCLSVLILPCVVFASSSRGESPVHAMALFVMQLGVIICMARVGGGVFKHFKLPVVLGELLSGILIGPYLLGGVSLPGFPSGFFPLQVGDIPVTIELYGMSTVASIILLFAAGLETDLKMFVRYSLTGSIVGLGGLFASFIVGNLTAQLLIPSVSSFFDPVALILGVMSTATSVGITVTILSDKRKLDSPEGVTILSAAVIDDILGIIILAVILGISATSGGDPDWSSIGMIGLKAVGVWLFFTFVGLLSAARIGRFLKRTNTIEQIAILSLGLALLLAGLFEQAGLAMIIGAYVMGLSFSKTDLSLSIEEHLQPIQSFFVPIFFAVMGMMVNVQEMFAPALIMFGLTYSFGAIFSKVIGAVIPALFLNFNFRGALRIGLGMIPRGEVALIIAGIGLSSGILSNELYSSSILMTLVTTFVAPILFSASLTDKKGTKKDFPVEEVVSNSYSFPTDELTDLVETKLLSAFTGEGFFVNRLKGEEKIFRFQREDSMITYTRELCSFRIECSPVDENYIKNIVYETLADMQTVIEKIKSMAKPVELKREVAKDNRVFSLKTFNVFRPELIKLSLRGKTKDAILEEMVQLFFEHGYIKDYDEALKAVRERESAISTGMQYGVAIPHGRIDEIPKILCAVGFVKDGVDFKSLDGEPSRLFVMTLVPTTGQVPYVQFLAALSSNLNSREKVEEILSLNSSPEVIDYFEED